MPLLVILLFLFVFPWLAILLLLFFALLIPLGFTLRSFFWVFMGPTQLFRILSNKKIRRNHALEHATIAVLEERYGVLSIEGASEESGFSLSGGLDPDEVLAAAEQALLRLRKGETSLAIHSKCGTTIVVVNTLSALVFLLLLWLTDNLSILAVLVALAVAHFLGTKVSPAVQRYITTDTRLDGLEITGVDVKRESRGFGPLTFVVPSALFVRTRMAGEPLEAEVVS